VSVWSALSSVLSYSSRYVTSVMTRKLSIENYCIGTWQQLHIPPHAKDLEDSLRELEKKNFAICVTEISSGGSRLL